MNSQTRDFRYGQPTSSLVLMIAVAWFIPLLCAKLASGNPLGHSLLGGLIHLSPNIIWGLAGVSAITALGATIFGINSMRAPKFVSLSSSSAVVPKAAFLGGKLTIPYKEISKIEQGNSPRNQKSIVISSSLGKSRLLSSSFDSSSDLDAFCSELQRRVAGAGLKKSTMPKHSDSQLQPEATQTKQLDPQAAALLRAIEEQRKTDPLIGAKIGSKEVNQRLINAMKNEKGVHVESLLCALGALAGYSCQANLRAQALEKGMPETAAFTVVDTADGNKYFFGDPLNQVLAESQYSVWGLAAGAAQHNGCTSLPDISEIFSHVTKTVGGVEFGIPRIPDGHKPGDTPINYVKVLWPNLLPIMKQFCQKPSEWPILLGLAVQEIMEMSKGVITPDLALKIVMESAIPMSKIDLASA